MTTVIKGDCRDVLRLMDDNDVNCCVTSPPYFGLRDYGVEGQIGLEPTPDVYVAELVAVFREVKRVLRDDGTLWLNLGDSYGAFGGNTYAGFNKRWSGTGGAGSKQDETLQGITDHKANTGLRPKNLLGIPWRVAFALQSDGWYLRQDIIWAKPNPMPESVKDRCTKSHEYIFLLSKSDKYYYDAKAIMEPARNRGTRDRSEMRSGTTDPKLKHHGLQGKPYEENPTRNKRDVWTVTTKAYKGAHFATFPKELIRPCILAGCPKGGTVLDPFGGSGTTGEVAQEEGRDAVLIELNPNYIPLIHTRTSNKDTP
jgi:DNA modification methylase